jgi:hypothetical protein
VEGTLEVFAFATAQTVAAALAAHINIYVTLGGLICTIPKDDAKSSAVPTDTSNCINISPADGRRI